MSFPRYPEYKDSGVEWLGEVPEHWERLKLKQVVSGERPITYGIVQAGENVADGVPYIRPTDMTDEHGVKDEASLLRTSLEIALAYRRSALRSGDIVCSIGPSYGKTMITPSSLDGANLTQGTARVAVNNKNSTKFIYWSLRSQVSFQQWECSVGGATFRALNLGPLSETVVAQPILSEQKQIARFLDHETAKIDALIQEQQRLIQLLKEKRQAVISHAVTKGLDPAAPMKDSGVEWLGEVPEHWDVKQLKHVVDPASSITYGIVQAGPEYGGGVPYIRTSDMSNEQLPVDGYPHTSPDIDEAYARSRVRPGDIVMSIRASVGKCLPIPAGLKIANLTQGTAKISPGKDTTRDFVIAFLNSSAPQSYFDLMAKGATFKEITLDALRRTPILLPPLEEQKTIDRVLARKTGVLDRLLRVAIGSTELLKERRSTLISAAVTGKIDVRNWKPPADEGAFDEKVRQGGLEMAS